ncbi:MAG: polyphosphate:AMP phosphotransferase [Alphaproteobacteria bacterium]|jgi:polyphosphate:AMP phosphotransferase|nr:polyphosphate:AMP phosphotransferase [Alphaproteobacteria bacterium]
MFRTAEIGRKIGKTDFEEIAPPLRIELIELQQRLRAADFPAIFVFAGVDGAGKGRTINLINEWMDPRWIVSRAYGPPSDEERERPEFWRYWRDLPPEGRIGLFLRSWYSRPVLDRVHGRSDDGGFEGRLDRIARFEQCLAADGALIVKFWMHLSRDAQKRLFRKWEADPHESWRVSDTDWEHWRLYDKFTEAAERTIIKTSTGSAPWHIVEGEDQRYREITVLTTIRDALVHQFERAETRRRTARALSERRAANGNGADGEPASLAADLAAATGRERTIAPPHQPSVLHVLDMRPAVTAKEAKKGLRKETARLNSLYRQARTEGISTVVVFEGWDAAGKGGAIRRLTAAIDARDYLVIQTAAPTDEERQHHYLWRFWRHLQRAGRVTIFDRSWYGRVLVERVEGYAAVEEWSRAYAEINDFERDLAEHGILVVKFWLHITPEEQLRRFERRAEIPYKRWKLTEEDWRNREKWPAYEAAVNDMVQRTSTRTAPWILVEADDKPSARLKVVRTLCDRLEAALSDPGHPRCPPV